MDKTIKQRITKQPKFINCISLGWYCGTAASMTIHGLRSHSGPFDWYYSDLESVLKVIESDFLDFMLKENLYTLKHAPTTFHDKKYGFEGNHDISVNFEQEYDKIYEKYQRRANRFMENVKLPTCFIRAIRTEDEISYVKKNKDYIFNIIKKGNPNNQIIFLLLKDMQSLPEDFLWFRLNDSEYSFKGHELYCMFDSSDELIKYFHNEFMSKEIINKNLVHDASIKAMSMSVIHKKINEKNNDIEFVFKDYFSNIDRGIYLWGAGFNSIALLDYVIDHGIKINAIIDNDKEKIGTTIKDIPIISFCEIHLDYINIFITISSKKAILSISKQVNDRCTNSNILTWYNLYERLCLFE